MTTKLQTKLQDLRQQEQQACMFFADELETRMHLPNYSGVIMMETRPELNAVMEFFRSNLQDKHVDIRFNKQRMAISLDNGSQMLFRTYPRTENEVMRNYAGYEFTSVGCTRKSWYEMSEYSQDFIMSRLRSQCCAPSRLSII